MEHSPLGNLPPELRNRIYVFALRCSGCICVSEPKFLYTKAFIQSQEAKGQCCYRCVWPDNPNRLCAPCYFSVKQRPPMVDEKDKGSSCTRIIHASRTWARRDTAALKCAHALFLTCRQLSAESTSFFYGNNAFAVAPDSDPDLVEFTSAIGARNAKCIERVTFYADIEDPLSQMLETYCYWCHRQEVYTSRSGTPLSEACRFSLEVKMDVRPRIAISVASCVCQPGFGVDLHDVPGPLVALLAALEERLGQVGDSREERDLRMCLSSVESYKKSITQMVMPLDSTLRS